MRRWSKENEDGDCVVRCDHCHLPVFCISGMLFCSVSKSRYFRQQKGLSQEQLGKRACIHENTIRKYELGIRKPKLDQLKKIAGGLGVSVIEFIDIEIENEADLIAVLKKISPFFKWENIGRILEQGEQR